MPDSLAAPLPVEQRLFSRGKKRVLTLDGGGTRGIVTIAFLSRMEWLLREETGRKDLVLSDVFDMIAGTSVGSMLATMLALGYEAKAVESKFRELAPRIFKGRNTILGLKRYDARNLVNGVRSIVKDETLGSPMLQTGLCLVAKRVDTGSPWVLSNNPRMPFYDDGIDSRGEKFLGNKHYKLESLIRASTAAPFLFSPTEITIDTDVDSKTGQKVDDKGLFIDGGMSPHNNPSLQLLLMAGLPPYKLDWTLTPDDLMMISVGTGQFRTKIRSQSPVINGWKAKVARGFTKNVADDLNNAAFAAQAMTGLIGDSGVFALTMMQALSHPRFSWRINGEVGALDGVMLLAAGKDLGAGAARGLLKFQRYDLPLEMNLVPKEFDVEADAEFRASLHAMDAPENVSKLYDLASAAALKQVSTKDFEGFI